MMGATLCIGVWMPRTPSMIRCVLRSSMRQRELWHLSHLSHLSRCSHTYGSTFAKITQLPTLVMLVNVALYIESGISSLTG